MQSLLIKHAQIITPEAVLESGYLEIQNGKISGIYSDLPTSESAYDRVIDGLGQYAMPGIMDIHTDAIEKEISPRPQANFPTDIAFRELERRMSGCGVTTVFHSLYLGYYAADNNDSSYRKALFEQLGSLCEAPTLIDNRIHLRFEVTGIEEYDTCMELLDQGIIHMLSFMDHSPGQGQYGSEKYKKYLLSTGVSEEEIQAQLEASLKEPRLTEEQMKTISTKCSELGIPVASHDDDNSAKVQQMHKLGATICEFPINEEAARKGLELDMRTVGGASNILRGGSLSGNLHIQEAVEAGLIDTLCSDYYPPSLLHAVFKLVQDNSLSLPEAVKLVSLQPAKAALLDKYKGSLEVGKDADIVLIRPIDGTFMVSHTLLHGNVVAQASFRSPNMALK